MNDVVVAVRAGAPIRLQDIGRVYSGYKERNIITRLDGQESVEIAVFKAADANTVSVAGRVRERLAELERAYEGKRDPLKFDVVFDQSRFIQQSVNEVLQTALIGGVLAVVVLLVFLRSIKSTLIIALSIPISIVATFFMMYGFHVSLNIMSLSGLALGIGMLVDNSIVVLESIHRYQRMGYAAREAANRGAGEVGQAVVASTMTTICVFAPIVFVEGVAGQLFADQAMTVTFALLASLLVAIMLIPMLSSLGGDVEGERAEKATGKVFFLVPAYLWILRGALKARMLAIVLAVGLFGGAILILSQIGAELIPEISQGEFFVDFELAPGIPLEDTSGRLLEVEERVRNLSGLSSFYTIVGSGNQTGVSAVEEREHIGQTLVRLESGILHEREEAVIDDLRARLQDIPGIDYTFSRPTLFSFKTPVEVIVQGYNLDALKRHTERLKDRIEELEGLRDLRASTEGGNPEVHIRFDRRKLASYGMTVNQGAALIKNKVLGEIPTEFNEGDRKIDIRVRVTEDDRRSLSELREMVLEVAGRSPIRLSSVANVSLQEGPAEIRRIGPQRAAVITGNIHGIDLQSQVRAIESELEAFQLPPDFTAYVGGQSEERSVAFQSMRFAIVLAIFLVYLVMASQFESLVQPFVIMFAIPFGVIGVALVLWATQQVLNVVVLIGTVILAGIVVNNSIVLIDFTNKLRELGKSKFEAVQEACAVRVRPILMTTSTTVLGLIPMALSRGEGAELRMPLAITVIGGLVVSTLLTLVLVPVLYTLVVREKQS